MNNKCQIWSKSSEGAGIQSEAPDGWVQSFVGPLWFPERPQGCHVKS